ncbi:TetR/AcrR family transcriptional regulator [Clostridium thermosuccinogenes]|jgi:AcrR family transcriptional regulator|nr:TetR/AcrR family transcriptional regulator [Pseudoclostridium thermosuccinogenes]
MQYLKDDVKEAIVRSALMEFKSKSYLEASMRTIAKNAGITAGNIYRYFQSKDDLFNYIMDPVWKDVTRIIFDNYEYTEDFFPITEIINSIMYIYKRFNAELFILLNNSKGSKYENVKERLVSLISKRLEDEMAPFFKADNREVKDTFIFNIISNAVVESIYLIMKECGDDYVRVEALTKQMITVFAKDLYHRL